MSAAGLFWAMGMLKVVLSMPLQIRAARAPTEENLDLARSQRKDDWLVTAIMAVALVCDEYPLTGWIYLQVKDAMHSIWGDGAYLSRVVYLFGTLAMAWLIQRTRQRLRLLKVK